MSLKYREDLKNKIFLYQKEILVLFFKKQIVKDLIEGSIINILITEEDINSQENNFSLLSINEVSLPLINLPFRYHNKVINLNKDTLLEIASSYIPVMAYKNSLHRFIKGFKMKRHEVKANIRNFMHSHQIYFTPLKEDIHGITNHAGDIFINYKYLKQYFEEKNLDNKLIIREKIVLAFLKELNQGLIKYLDEKKYSNILSLYNLEKEGIPNKAVTQLKFRKLETNETFVKPLIKSIDNFNHILFGGYIFEKMTIEIAIFLLHLRIYRGKKIHFEKLNSMFKTIKKKYHFGGIEENLKMDKGLGLKEDEDEEEENEDKDDNDKEDEDGEE